MSISYRYLGFLGGGQTVAVRLNQQSHVALVDTANLQRYRNQRSYRHYGELQTYPEERYRVPYQGEWHIVIFNHSPLNQIRLRIDVR